MVSSPQPLLLPSSISTLLSGDVWSNNPAGTPVSLTYNVLSQAPINPLPTDYNSSVLETAGWAPVTTVEQPLVSAALATISAVANITFTASSSESADMLIGTDTNPTYAAFTSYAEGATPTGPLGNFLMTQTHIEISTSITPSTEYGAAEWTYAFIHEIQNSTGLSDGVLPPGIAQFEVVGYSPAGANCITPTILAAYAWQYLYGANESGYTPSATGATAILSGSDLTYSFGNLATTEDIWVGTTVATATCFDFSSCTGPIVIDLTPGTYSSSGEASSGAGAGFANAPYQNIGIDFGTTIQLGIANNVAGAELYADITPTNNDILVGGSASATFNAGAGKDIFLSGGGADGAVFHDASTDYTVTTILPGVIIVTDNAASPSDGTIVLDGDFTRLQFADKTIAEAASTIPATTVSAPAAIIQGNLDALQYLVGRGLVTSIVVTDSGFPTISVTAAQLINDDAALRDMSGNFAIDVNAAAPDLSINGVAGHANMAIFTGAADQYSVAASRNGDGLIVTDTEHNSVDSITNISALQFADVTEIVAAPPGPASAVSTGNVTELYAAVLDRAPDLSGLTFYQTYLQNNPTTPLQQFALWFLSSTEYSSAHSYAQSSAGDTQFIEDSYENLLHRTPSASEVSFYETTVLAPAVAGLTPGTNAYASAQLQAHALMLVYFSASAEFLADVQVTTATPASPQHWLVLT